MLRSLTLSPNGACCLAPTSHHRQRGGVTANSARPAARRQGARPVVVVVASSSSSPSSSSSLASPSASSAAVVAPGQQLQLPRLAALNGPQSLVSLRAQPLQRLTWRVGSDDCALEVFYRPPWRQGGAAAAAGAAGLDGASASSPPTLPSARPPVLLVHGLFRAAWSWEESFLPALSASGRAAYAVSLRGQGGSELAGSGSGSNVAAAVEEAGGVPMDVIMADLEAVVARVAEHQAEEARRWREWEAGVNVGGGGEAASQSSNDTNTNSAHAPVLVGHSLGGMFVQEYLARLHRSDQTGQQKQQQQGAAAAASASPAAPPPAIRGAALLASATAGTVMDFLRFASDVGLPEFLWQMWIVATGQHLRDLSVARYCWWPDEAGGGGGAGGEGRSGSGGVPAEQARRWHALIAASSRASPYVPGEVTRWNPPPRPQQLQLLKPEQEDASADADAPAPSAAFPPVLALGGAHDRIIRPWQVAAARAHWGADVVVLPGLTHDVMLGPGADRALSVLVDWLERRVEQQQRA